MSDEQITLTLTRDELTIIMCALMALTPTEPGMKYSALTIVRSKADKYEPLVAKVDELHKQYPLAKKAS